MGDFLFVLKDKGTSNQGWWLKVTNAQELAAYYEIIAPTRTGNAVENYMFGKEFNKYKKVPSSQHSPHIDDVGYTQAVAMYAEANHKTFLDGLTGFNLMVAQQQLDSIHEHGAIYINAVGGYHGAYNEKEEEYAFVRRKELVWPDYKKQDIRIKQFPNGTHFYAYIGDMQVKDGDKLKWDTYEEAQNYAESILDESERIEEFEY